MRRARGWWTAGAFGLAAAAAGCGTTDTKDVSAPYVEEFRLPPNEDRFNHPPETGYRKPPPKKEFTPGLGGPNGPSGGGMAGGPGGLGPR